VAETLDQIGALVPLGVFRWIRPERGLVEEHAFQTATVARTLKGKPKIVPRVVSRTGSIAAIRYA